MQNRSVWFGERGHVARCVRDSAGQLQCVPRSALHQTLPTALNRRVGTAVGNIPAAAGRMPMLPKTKKPD